MGGESCKLSNARSLSLYLFVLSLSLSFSLSLCGSLPLPPLSSPTSLICMHTIRTQAPPLSCVCTPYVHQATISSLFGSPTRSVLEERKARVASK